MLLIAKSPEQLEAMKAHNPDVTFMPRPGSTDDAMYAVFGEYRAMPGLRLDAWRSQIHAQTEGTAAARLIESGGVLVEVPTDSSMLMRPGMFDPDEVTVRYATARDREEARRELDAESIHIAFSGLKEAWAAGYARAAQLIGTMYRFSSSNEPARCRLETTADVAAGMVMWAEMCES